jgi:hypothetical protein
MESSGDAQPGSSAASTVLATAPTTMTATATVPTEMVATVPAMIEGMADMVEAVTEGMVVAKAVIEVAMEAAAEAAAAVIEIELTIGSLSVIIIRRIAVVGGLAGAGCEDDRGADHDDDRRDLGTAARHAASIERFGPSVPAGRRGSLRFWDLGIEA